MEKICKFNGCNNLIKSKGFCSAHYQQNLYGKELKPIKRINKNGGRKKKWNGIECEVVVCKNETKVKGLCFKHYQRLRNFNIDRDELIRLTNICEVCGIDSNRSHLDHDHETNKVRGILCHQCNIALGMIKENETIAENLIKYIQKYSK